MPAPWIEKLRQLRLNKRWPTELLRMLNKRWPTELLRWLNKRWLTELLRMLNKRWPTELLRMLNKRWPMSYQSRVQARLEAEIFSFENGVLLHTAFLLI